MKTRGWCSVSECRNPHYAKGVCHSHYNSLRWGEEVGPDDACVVRGCKLRHVARGFCIGHYDAFWCRKKREEMVAAGLEDANE